MNRSAFCLSILIVLAGGSVARGHLPYLERVDYRPDQPAEIRDVTQSLAYYSWLQDGNDVDVYRFSIAAPTRLKIEFLVPACPAYFRFFPRFAIIGPGLSVPPGFDPASLPVPLPPGHGVMLFSETPVPLRQRPVMYEPFGGKWYFEGPEFDATITGAGAWQIVVWDAGGMTGDYVMAPGYVESFKGPEVIQALINTTIIRQNGELHSPCGRRSAR